MADTELIVRIAAQDTASRNIKQLQSSVIRLVGAVASLAAAFKAITFPIQQSIAFERALRDIQKTTEFSDSSINTLGRSLRDLSTDTGVAATDLAEIAARAGQLGLGVQGQQAILDFTETIARFATVADLSVSEAATSIAKLTNIFKLPIAQAEKLSATLNELSNSTTATADELLDVIQRVGDASGLLSFQDAAALAAQGLGLGQTAEVVGTAITKTFSNASTNAKAFAQVMNITTTEWTSRLQGDALGSIQAVAVELSKLGTLERNTLIRELFGGGRQFSFGAKFVQDAANDFRVLGSALGTASKAYIEGTSSQREYLRISDSVARQSEVLKARFNELALQFGNVLLPVVRRVVDGLNDFLSDTAGQARIQAFAEAIRDAANAMVDWIAALSESKEAFKTLFTVVKVFIGLGLVSLFTTLAGRVVALVAHMVVLARVTGQAALSWTAFGAAVTGAAQGLSLAQIAVATNAGIAGKAVQGLAAIQIGAASRLAKAQQAVAARNAAANAASAAASVQTTRQIALQARRNSLELQYIKLRNTITRTTIAQAQAQGLGTAAVAARARKVRDSVSRGFAPRAADAAQLKTLNTALAGTNTLIARTAATTKVASRAVGSLLGIFGRLGAGLISLVTGPYAVLALIFGPTLIDLVRGFFNSMNDEIDEAGARTRAGVEKQLAETEKLISGFRESAEKGLTIVPIKIETDSASGGLDFEKLERDIATTTTATVRAIDNFKGGLEEEKRFLAAANDVRRTIRATNEEISKQEDLLRRINQTGPALSPLDAEAKIVAQAKLVTVTIDEQGKEVVTGLLEQRRLLDESLKDLEKNQKNAGAAAFEFFAKANTGASTLSQVITKSSLEYVENAREIGRLDVALAESQKNAKEALTASTKAAAGGVGGLELAAISANAQAAQSKVNGLLGDISKLKNKGEDIAKSIPTEVLNSAVKVLVNLEQVGDKTLDTFKELVERSPLAPIEIEKEKINSIVSLLAQAAVLRTQVELFDQIRKRVENTAASIKGMFDNLSTSARASRVRIEELGEKIASTLRNRTIEFDIKLKNRREGGFIDRDLERLTKQFDKEISIVDESTRAGRKRANNLRTQFDLHKTILETQKNNLEVEREADSLRRRASSATADLSASLAKQKVFAEEIKNATGDSPQEIAVRQARLEDANRLTQRVRDQRDAQQEILTLMTDFNKTVAIDPGIPEGDQRFVFSQEELTRSKEALDRVNEIVEGSINNLITVSNEEGKTLSNVANKLAGITKVIQDIDAAIVKMSEGFGTIPAGQFIILRDAADRIVKAAGSIGDIAVAEIAKIAATAADAIPIPTITLTDLKIDADAIAAQLRPLAEDLLGSASTSTSAGVSAGLQDFNTEDEQKRQLDLLLDAKNLNAQMQEIKWEPITVPINGVITATQGSGSGSIESRARGGYIRGPGTGTSDSILARLSNGEYVMDAMTTGFFGPSFFRGLQKAAKTRNAFAMPKFATGGLVGDATKVGQTLNSRGRSSEEGSREVVELNFNIEGESARLSGDRAEVAKLTQMLRNVTRGATR